MINYLLVKIYFLHFSHEKKIAKAWIKEFLEPNILGRMSKWPYITFLSLNPKDSLHWLSEHHPNNHWWPRKLVVTWTWIHGHRSPCVRNGGGSFITEGSRAPAQTQMLIYNIETEEKWRSMTIRILQKFITPQEKNPKDTEIVEMSGKNIKNSSFKNDQKLQRRIKLIYQWNKEVNLRLG